MSTRFDTKHERDGQTDTCMQQSRGKNARRQLVVHSHSYRRTVVTVYVALLLSSWSTVHKSFLPSDVLYKIATVQTPIGSRVWSIISCHFNRALKPHHKGRGFTRWRHPSVCLFVCSFVWSLCYKAMEC